MRLAKVFGFPPMSRCQFFQANLAAPHLRPRARARRSGRKQIPRVRWLAVSLFVSVDGWGVCGSKDTVRRLQVAQRMFLRMSIAPPSTTRVETCAFSTSALLSGHVRLEPHSSPESSADFARSAEISQESHLSHIPSLTSHRRATGGGAINHGEAGRPSTDVCSADPSSVNCIPPTDL